MNELIISPSVLSLDYANTKEQIALLNQSKAKWLHFDVMDGHFVPNISFGPDILKAFSKSTDLVLDVHLMVSDPVFYAPIFIKAGADMVVFHTEALDNDVKKIAALLKDIKAQNVMCGFTVKPGTPIVQFESLLPLVDMVLIMSVEPGFGGQSFMENQLSKVAWLKEKRESLGLDYRIEIDGGINGETYKKALEAGCDTLVAGSYVFKNDIIQTIEGLLQ
ncbi:MAG: ribulose-phosphate 3-epimerase [Firmicutes bacterium]|nr:ribulose-phosphate 3-epimerase [Bacillota bacterium]